MLILIIAVAIVWFICGGFFSSIGLPDGVAVILSFIVPATALFLCWLYYKMCPDKELEEILKKKKKYQRLEQYKKAQKTKTMRDNCAKSADPASK